MRIAFMGTPPFAAVVLAALAQAGIEIARVYTQPPRPAGRGKAARPSAVAEMAARLGLEIAAPERFRGAVIDDFAALGVDAAAVVAYGQILPQAALDVPPLGCWNLHASLLPRWRGAAPIQRAIMAGDTETGVCVMRMEAGLDTGPVLMCAVTPIGAQDTAASLHDRLAELGAPLMVEALGQLGQMPKLQPTPQPETGITYAAKIDKAEARIDWARPAAAVSAHIRGLSPFPGAWFTVGSERIKALMAVVETGSEAGVQEASGTVLDTRLMIACQGGAVRLTRLQRAGRGPQDAEALLRGFTIAQGTRLE
ncbi:MAG: methionyl-tRNA formyltransferase [Pseudomonadota bacterium]